MKSRPFEFLVLDTIPPFAEPVYDLIGFAQPPLALVAHYENGQIIIKEEVVSDNKFWLKPMIDLESNEWMYSKHWWHIPPLVTEAVNKMICELVRRTSVVMEANDYWEAHGKAAAYFMDTLKDKYPSGMIAIKADPVSKLCKRAKSLDGLLDLLGLHNNTAAEYDLRRRSIIIPDLPENTFVFLPSPEYLGVMANSQDLKKFGMFVVGLEHVLIFKCKNDVY